MSGAQLSSEINAAIAEASSATGDGSTAILLEPVGQAVNPWDEPAGSQTEHEVNAVTNDAPFQWIDGTLIQQGDKFMTLPSRNIDDEVLPPLKISWRVLYNGVNYAIIGIRETTPGGVALKYEVQLRA